MTTGFTHAYAFEDRTLVDREGGKIGTVDALYTDSEGGQPEWALVNTGLFGTKKTFVPLRGAEPTGEDVRVPVDKAQVKDAPRIDADGELSETEERTLFEHYGVPYTTAGSATATGGPREAGMAGDDRTGYTAVEERASGFTSAEDRDVSGRTTGDDAMRRSEEELRVGTERREVERVRLSTDTHIDEETVSEEVRKERIETEGDSEPVRQS